MTSRLAPLVLVAAMLPLGCASLLPAEVSPSASPSVAPTLAPLADSNQPTTPGAKLSLVGPATISMNVGEQRPLATLFLDGKGQVPTDTAVWTSSADGTVSVNPTSGVAQAVAKGTVVVTVALRSDPSVKSQVTINVENQADVKAFTVTPGTQTLAVGKTQAFTAAITLGTGEVKSNVIWSTSDPTIASVDASGVVTALGVGTVQVLASYADAPNFKGQATLRVTGATAAQPTPGPTPAGGTDDGPGTVAEFAPGDWVQQPSHLTNALTYMRFFDAQHGVAAGQGGLATTADGGETWTASADANLAAGTAFDFQTATDGWMAAGDKLYGTKDGAAFSVLVDFKADHNTSIAAIARSSASEGLVLGKDGNLYASHDGGASFGALTVPTSPAAAAYRTQAYNFQDTWSYGPLATVPGGGAAYFALHDVSCLNQQSHSYYDCLTPELCVNTGGLDAGGWATLSGQPNRLSLLVFTSAKEGWRSGDATLERTVDGGKTWLNAPLPNVSQSGQPLHVRFTDASHLYVVCPKGFYLTADDGRNWRYVPLDMTVGDLAVADDKHLWAAGKDGVVQRYVVK